MYWKWYGQLWMYDVVIVLFEIVVDYDVYFVILVVSWVCKYSVVFCFIILVKFV